MKTSTSYQLSGADFSVDRYHFNGKETDGETEWQDYGMRMYSPYLGRFLSVDPLQSGYPWYSSYQFAGNKPIACSDLDGAEELVQYVLDIGQEYPIIATVEWQDIYPGETHGPMGSGTAVFNGSIRTNPDGTRDKVYTFTEYIPTEREIRQENRKAIFKEAAAIAMSPIAYFWDYLMDPGGLEQVGTGHDSQNSTQSKSKRVWNDEAVNTEELLELIEMLSIANKDWKFEKPGPPSVVSVAERALDAGSSTTREYRNGDSVGPWVKGDRHWVRDNGDSIIWVEPSKSTKGPSTDTVDVYNRKTSQHNYKMSQEQEDLHHDKQDNPQK